MGVGIADKKMFFIVNPYSGGGKTRLWWEDFRHQLDNLAIDYSWEYTAAAGSAGIQSRRAVLERGAQAVIVVGGDGTLFEVLNGLVENDCLISKDLVFSVFASGSACDFARMIYPKGDVDRLRLLTDGVVRNIDIGRAVYQYRGKEQMAYFINSFDAGAGADTCKAVNTENGRIKRLLHNGPLSFMLTALRVLMTFKYTDTMVDIENEHFSGRYIIIGAGNGSYIGGGMMLFPQADLNDGMLDLLLVEQRSRLEILRIFNHVYDGSFIHEKGIVYRRAQSIKIKTERPIVIELDGEVPGNTETYLTVLPSMLPVLYWDA